MGVNDPLFIMIEVYDNFLELQDINSLYKFCSLQPYSISGKSRNHLENQYENRDLTLISRINESTSFHLIDKIQQSILKLLDDNFFCFRRYINAFKFSDASLSHVDYCPSNTTCKTALIYCNIEWDIDWGGETIFLDSFEKTSEIIKSIIPKPGRMVLFDSKIPHLARVPNVLYPGYRYSLVYNFDSEIKNFSD